MLSGGHRAGSVAAGFVALTACLAVGVAWAANPAALDTSFSGDGTRKVGFRPQPHEDAARDVVVTPGGKVIAAGYTDQAPGDDSFSVARLTESGALDPTFSADGKRVVDFGSGADRAEAVALQGDGRVVLAGTAVLPGNALRAGLARLTANGQLDDTFSGDGRLTAFGTDSRATAVAIQPDGRIVAAGVEGVKVAVTRHLPNGQPDQSFSGDGIKVFGFPGKIEAGAGAIAIDGSGRLVIAGTAGHVMMTGAGSLDFAVARLLPDGRFDPTFSSDGRRLVAFTADSGGPEGARGVALHNGRIVLAGTIPSHAVAVARLRTGGALDIGFDGDGKRVDALGEESEGEDVAVQPNGKVLVAGWAAPDYNFALVRYRPDGSRDPSFSGDGVRFTPIEIQSDARARAVDLDRDGRIVVAGPLFDDGGNTSYAIVRHLGGP